MTGMLPELVDTHCHLNHADFDADRDAVRARAAAAGVRRLLCIGYDRASSRRALDLADGAAVWAAVGVHPESAGEWGADAAGEMAALYAEGAGRVAAWGEIGLDYHWDTVPRARQREVFAAQITLARSLSPALPLIIHNREALDDILGVLRESGTPAPVVMHCFTGGVEDARRCLDAGCFLGIGGVATFKKSDALRAAVAWAPADRLLLETDCPYLAPPPHRGRRNEPSYLPAVAQAVAAARGLSVEEVAALTTANARALFGLR